ncbi:Vitamin B6 photo-protection and homoeostasis [Fragilaria crotonensis]|nr:Vitamin B6 photo-protection and homoeostasis [Fragilaria crotonensis]
MSSRSLVLEFDEDPALTESTGRRPHWEYTICSSGVVEKHRRFGHDRERQPDGTAPTSTADWIRHYIIGIPKQVVKDMFLPLDYPHSVTKEYMPYQICDSLQGLCSYLRGVVSTSAVLTAAGVGNSEATAMSAAMTWAIRDGVGMIGALTFSYSASSLFDGYVKEFRLFADIINDVGLTLDMLAPYFGSENILYVGSAATICKIMCGIAAGATKGSITQHFSTRGNMADLNAKEGTQETLVSLVGMILGVMLAKHLNKLEEADKFTASSVSWTIFIALTIVHVVVNYIGVKLLRLRTLNAQRTREAFNMLVDITVHNCENSSDAWVEKALGTIPSPDELSESLLASTQRMLFQCGVILDARVDLLVKALPVEELSKQLYGADGYLIGVSNQKVVIALKAGASEEDQLRAFVHALIVKKCLTLGKSFQGSHACMKQLVAKRPFLQLMGEIGWDVKGRLYLGFGRRRVQATKKSKDE